MKKKYFLLFVFILSLSLTLVSFNIYKGDGPASLILNYIPPKNNNDNQGGARSPSTPVYAQQQNHTIIIGSAYEGCLIELLEQNEVIWSDYVGNDGTVVIPETIVGVFNLMFYVDDATYMGEVILE